MFPSAFVFVAAVDVRVPAVVLWCQLSEQAAVRIKLWCVVSVPS